MTLDFARTAVTNFQAEPLIGVLNTRGCENFAILDRNRRLSQKQYEIGPWLLWIAIEKSLSIRVGSDDLE